MSECKKFEKSKRKGSTRTKTNGNDKYTTHQRKIDCPYFSTETGKTIPKPACLVVRSTLNKVSPKETSLLKRAVSKLNSKRNSRLCELLVPNSPVSPI